MWTNSLSGTANKSSGSRWFWAFLLAFFLFSGPPLFSQDFEDGATYKVTGAELNRLNRDLLTAQNSLAASQAENAKLKKDSTDKQKTLEQLQGQLQTVSQSFKKLQDEALINLLEAVGVTFLATLAADEIAHGAGWIK